MDRFLSLIHENFKDPANVAGSAERRRFVISVVGGAAESSLSIPEVGELSGLDTIHKRIHHLIADCQHRKLDRYVNTSDASQRRRQKWTDGFEVELSKLAHHYFVDLTVNHSRYDSWLSLGQCYAWLAENNVDQRVLGVESAKAAVAAAAAKPKPAEDGAAEPAAEAESPPQADFELTREIGTHFARAKCCYLFASTLDNKRSEHWDQLGFLAFTRLRYGRRDSAAILEAVECFSKAMERNQEEWMYPFMIGKLQEMNHAPGKVYLALYDKAITLHRRTQNILDDAELFYRLHASRLKCALTDSIEDEDTWQLLQKLSYEIPPPDADTASANAEAPPPPATAVAAGSVSERRAVIVANVVKALRDIRDPKFGTRKAAFARNREYILKNLKWFFKGVHCLGAHLSHTGDYRGCVTEMSVLFNARESAHFFWQMHNYRYTDFGDIVFVTESKFDIWRIRCFYLYVHALMRSDDPGDELMKLNECLRRGSDKRKLNRRWTQEARCCALLARFILVRQRFESLGEKMEAAPDAASVETAPAGVDGKAASTALIGAPSSAAGEGVAGGSDSMDIVGGASHVKLFSAASGEPNASDVTADRPGADGLEGHLCTALRAGCQLHTELERFPEMHEFAVETTPGNGGGGGGGSEAAAAGGSEEDEWTILGSSSSALPPVNPSMGSKRLFLTHVGQCGLRPDAFGLQDADRLVQDTFRRFAAASYDWPPADSTPMGLPAGGTADGTAAGGALVESATTESSPAAAGPAPPAAPAASVALTAPAGAVAVSTRVPSSMISKYCRDSDLRNPAAFRDLLKTAAHAEAAAAAAVAAVAAKVAAAEVAAAAKQAAAAKEAAAAIEAAAVKEAAAARKAAAAFHAASATSPLHPKAAGSPKPSPSQPKQAAGVKRSALSSAERPKPSKPPATEGPGQGSGAQGSGSGPNKKPKVQKAKAARNLVAVTFGEGGPLGITWRPGVVLQGGSHQSVVIQKIHDGYMAAAKAAATGLGEGLALWSVAGKTTVGAPYADVIKMIIDATRP